MAKQITIIAGHDTNGEREERTLAWLEQHGVTVEEYQDLQVLTFRKAEIEKGQYNDTYIIGFENAEGDQEQSWLYISLEPDPHETIVYVQYGGDYSCSCKGRGCAKCNAELEAIERGENPYAHHTSPRDLQLGDRVIRPGAQVAGKVIMTEPEHVTVQLDGLGERRYRKTEVVKL